MFAQDLASGIANGASITILWGLVLVTVCNICVALSLGEMHSAMPVALGQAYWTYRLWNTSLGHFVSYMCAWLNTFGWWALSASLNAFIADFLIQIKVMFDPNWSGVDKGWVHFLVYVGVTTFLTSINVVACRKEQILPWLNNFVGSWYTVQLFVLCLALLIPVGVKPELSYQSAKFVFGYWNNQTGWSDGVIWFVGLIQSAYGLTAYDSVIHMTEEIPAPRKNVPRLMWLSILFSAVTGFIFMVVCLFCIQDMNALVNADLPFITLLQSTIGLQGAATLIVLFTFNGLGAAVSVTTTSGRMTWGFARDGGIPWSKYLSHVDPVWKVPARALWAQGAITALIGILYLFSNTVLDAILSVSTVALTICYSIPIAVLLATGRSRLPPGPFRLGRWGPVLNWISIIYCVITTIFFLFPPSPNPSGADMNWAVAVLGVMLVIALAFWFITGKYSYARSEDSLIQIVQAQQPENEEEPTATEPVADNKAKQDTQTQEAVS